MTPRLGPRHSVHDAAWREALTPDPRRWRDRTVIVHGHDEGDGPCTAWCRERPTWLARIARALTGGRRRLAWVTDGFPGSGRDSRPRLVPDEVLLRLLNLCPCGGVNGYHSDDCTVTRT